MTHTPGPWHRNIKPARKYNGIFAGRNTHVVRLAVEGLTDDEIEANCYLVTAAPEMLAALKLLRGDIEIASAMLKMPMPDSARIADAAIAKAESRE